MAAPTWTTRYGHGFTESATYLENRDRILGVVTMRKRAGDLFGRDHTDRRMAGLTLSEAATSEQFSLPQRFRFRQVWTDYLTQLTPILQPTTEPAEA